jgi:beta-N-acetylhexosaminidase
MKQNLELWIFIAMLVVTCFVSGCSERIGNDEILDEIPAAEVDPIDEIIKSMTLRQKIAGLIIVGLEETLVNELIRQRWSEYPFGGVILFERNYIRDDWLKDFTSELQLLTASDYPLIICIDEEGGAISRLPGEIFPTAAEMAMMTEGDVLQVGRAIGEKLIGYGINTNLAPVLDVNVDPRNTVIGKRSFGSDPIMVGEYGVAFYKGLADSKVIAVGKHYPGHGSTLVDSHIALPVLDKNFAELKAFELIPFIKAVEADIPIIMTAHLVVSGIDDKPATMSRKMIEILRNEIGFDGVVISDDLEMDALVENYDWKEIVVGTFTAGVDLLLISHSPELQAEAVVILEEAYKEGIINDEMIDQSLSRVLKVRSTFKQVEAAQNIDNNGP